MLFAVSAGKNHKITQNLRNYSVNTRQRRDKLHYMRKLILLSRMSHGGPLYLGAVKEVYSMRKRLLSRCGTICKFASSSLLSFALDYGLFLGFSGAAGARAESDSAPNTRTPPSCFTSLRGVLSVGAGTRNCLLLVYPWFKNLK